MYQRLFTLSLPRGQSAFLWGPRKTGKSTYLQERFPSSVMYDLLKSDVYLDLLKSPHHLREEILALPPSALDMPIIIDEVQKIPLLLDEVHWLIENTPAYFILCGSSARKLKRGATNLLGGRAWRFDFFPLVTREIPEFDLLRALNHGLIPSHYDMAQPQRSLRSYVETYLKEEIASESLVRQLPEFAHFLESVAFSLGEMVNFSNIGRDCGVSPKTVKAYYQILIDTLMGYFIYPFYHKQTRDLITASPKFYLFDIGVSHFLSKTTISQLRGKAAGKAFEQFIAVELMAHRAFSEKHYAIHYWRTKQGAEVDFILNEGDVAIEVKITHTIQQRDLRGLKAFSQYHAARAYYLVCCIPRARVISLTDKVNVTLLPWQNFLERLWRGDIV